MNKIVVGFVVLVMMGGCVPVQSVVDYRPIVDSPMNAKYDNDLFQCRNIAASAEAEYVRKQNEEMGAAIIGGLITGAIVGNAIGGNSNWTGAGAASGVASGVASVDTELADGGPKRVVDRCMAGRGHRVLNDLGKGL